MAANKFATMLHRNTNKMTLILVYVVLEWTLIAVLLLNSLFSYLILKFADYFGLKRPCLWCSRLDHLFEPQKSGFSHRDLVCEAHATEISNLSYCLSHRKLAESRDMCEDCSPSSSSSEADDWPEKLSFFPWMKRIAATKTVEEEEEIGEDSKCSCCGVGVSKGFYSPCILIKPWGVLNYPQKNGLVVVDDDDKTFEADHSDHSRSDIVVDHWREEQVVEETEEVLREIEAVESENVDKAEEREEEKVEEDDFAVMLDCGQVCEQGIVLREIEAVEGENVDKVEEQEEDKVKEDGFALMLDCGRDCEQSKVLQEIEAVEDENVDEVEEKVEEKVEEDDFAGLLDYEQSKVEESVASETASEIPFKHLEFFIGQEDCTLIPVNLLESTEIEAKEGISGCQDVILDFDMEVKAQVELVTENWHSSLDSLELISSNTRVEKPELEETESSELSAIVFYGDGREFATSIFQPVCVSQGTQTLSDDENVEDEESNAQQGSDDDDLQMQSDEIDGEISIGTDIPDHEIESEDPSTSSINLHIDDNHESNLEQAEEEEPLEFKPLYVQMSEREEDGSVISDTEGAEGIPTVERLKSALRAEREALNALYMELEEERSASAVAASQTMAMINRLQEEKAAVQMEALQYQRMMEEQSEYDQEALQLLNELMMKREREKQELEKKVLEYEARDRMVFSRRTSTEYSDGISIDTNNEEQQEDDPNTPEEAVHCLEESLLGFEEERISILDQLRVLEEKLFSLSDGEKDEYRFEDIKLFTENGNGFSNGHFKAKRLLPFFDAEAEDYAKIHDETEVFEVDDQDSKKLTVEEEVDHVYERLNALEADREFLKHCISSLRKGDKGLFLLREILQHLRDLRNVEHNVKNVGI